MGGGKRTDGVVDAQTVKNSTLEQKFKTKGGGKCTMQLAVMLLCQEEH